MEQKKAKWTVIDTVIVLIVLAAAAVGVMKLEPMLSGIRGNEKITFTVMLKEQENEISQAMTVGDRVTVSLTEKDGGVITNIKTEPSERLTFNSIEGAYINELVSNKVDVYVTIEAECEVSDTAFKVGSTDIKVGKEVPVRGKGYASLGYIIELDK